MSEEGRPLITDVSTIAPPPAAPEGTQRIGPCHFGHSYTSAKYKGREHWMCNPSPSFWHDVTAGVTLCQKCYTRGRAARIRHGGQTAAKTKRQFYPQNDGMPPTSKQARTYDTHSGGRATEGDDSYFFARDGDGSATHADTVLPPGDQAAPTTH